MREMRKMLKEIAAIALLAVLGIVCVTMVVTNAKAQAPTPGVTQAPAPTSKVDNTIKPEYWPAAAVVQLHPGQKFIATERRSAGEGHSRYLTVPRPTNEAPRVITIWKPGRHPNSLEPDFFIQER